MIITAISTPPCIPIEGGSFLMGASSDDRFRNAHEQPQRTIEITSFEIGQYPVSAKEFGEFDARFQQTAMDDLPVVKVSWLEATAYCEWLSGNSDETFRLPSESEWEFVCRAGSGAPFPDGHLVDPESANLYYDEKGNRVGAGKLQPIGWGISNEFGVHDMIGNVCEWVADDWSSDLEAHPEDGGHYVLSTSDRKVIRGGGWDAMPRLARSSFRDFATANMRRDNLGFRVAKEIKK